MDPVKKFPAAVPSGGHILGQPFTLSNLSIPVNATFTCNCVQPPSDLQIRSSEPVTCPVCQKNLHGPVQSTDEPNHGGVDRR